MGIIYDPYSYIRHYWQGSVDNDSLVYSGGDDFINGREGFDRLIINSSIENFLIYTNYENITYLIDLKPVKSSNNKAFITTTDIEELVFNDSSVTLSSWPDNFIWIYTDDYQYIAHSRNGSSVNDLFDYIGGSDSIDGGNGSDAISLHSFSQDATITKSSDVTFIEFNNHEVYDNGSLLLINIEKIFFRDGEVLTDNLTYNTVDLINPSLSSSSPADDATAVEKTSNIVLNFSEAVDVETGNIVIYEASNDSVVETIDITDGSKVSGSGSTQITINPSIDLAESTSYYVQIASTAFDDSSSNSYAGINDKTTLSFTTADETAPIITGPSGSAAGATTSAISINENETAINKFTANESVSWSLNGGADASLFSINSSSGALSFSSAPNYESPKDSDYGNDYVVGVRATDDSGNTSDQILTVTIKDVMDKENGTSSFYHLRNWENYSQSSNFYIDYTEDVYWVN